MQLKGRFTFEQVRNGVVIARDKTPNMVITEGIAEVLDAAFGGVAASSPWYIGLIDNDPAPTLLTTDVLGGSGWTEIPYTTGYAETEREEWIDASTSGRIKSTTTVATFNMLGTYGIYGMFLCNAATGTTGVIWSEGAYDAVKPVVSTDVINATYEIEIA